MAKASAQSSGSHPALFSKYFRQISWAITFSMPVFREQSEVVLLGISLSSKSFCGKKSEHTRVSCKGVGPKTPDPLTSMTAPALQKLLRKPTGFQKRNAWIPETSKTAKNWRIAKFSIYTEHSIVHSKNTISGLNFLGRPQLLHQENGDNKTNKKIK